MDQLKLDAFSERVLSEVNAAMSCLNLYLGHRLGLYQALVEAGPVTPAELAGRIGCSERYLREWLECMAVGGYLDHEPTAGRFSLPPEHAVALLDYDNPAYVVPFTCFIPSFAAILTPLTKAFRSGGGVPYDAYGADVREAIGMGNRPMFVNDYVAKWIPAMPDIEIRLKGGGRVADIGCGVGWSSIALARGFPRIHIDAVDADPASIEDAQHNAQRAGVADRVVFHLVSGEGVPLIGPYDLVTAFECLHDMAYPVKALRHMRELAADGGAVLIADEAVGESLEENRNFLGLLNYNFSVLHCLPQAMVHPGAAGTGAVIRPSMVRAYAEEAGFAQINVLPIENRLWRFYRLTP